jgi:succinate dehydrogenase cytochrome b subunit
MTSTGNLMRSSIGAKIVMAITGVGLFLFVIAHLLGNLQVFMGQDVINDYGVLLRRVPELLWAVRIGLLTFVILHIVASIRVSHMNRTARTERYAMHRKQETGVAAQTMLWGGLLILAYAVYHLLHFTFRSVNASYSNLEDAMGRHDVYSMMIGSFQNPVISVTYIAAMIVLGLHLSHGIGGFLQTLGWGHPRYRAGMRRLGPIVATLIAAGYISIPVAVLLGILRLPSGGR